MKLTTREELRRSKMFEEIHWSKRKERMCADIRVRMTDKMRVILDLYSQEYGYRSMSKFCRDLLALHLDAYARERGLE